MGINEWPVSVGCIAELSWSVWSTVYLRLASRSRAFQPSLNHLEDIKRRSLPTLQFGLPINSTSSNHAWQEEHRDCVVSHQEWPIEGSWLDFRDEKSYARTRDSKNWWVRLHIFDRFLLTSNSRCPSSPRALLQCSRRHLYGHLPRHWRTLSLLWRFRPDIALVYRSRSSSSTFPLTCFIGFNQALSQKPMQTDHQSW